jgi:hypothetical protein
LAANMEAFRSMDGRRGSRVRKPYIAIDFQRGPRAEVGQNGCRIEDVIEVLQERLLDYQGRALACPENAAALGYLKSAREMLLTRKRTRNEQGVLHTPVPQESCGTET